MNKELKGSLILFLVAFIWGLAFVFQSICAEYMDAYTVLYFRSFIALIFLAPILIYSLRKDKKENRKYSLKDMIISGVFCGIFLSLASLFQQLGIEKVSAGKTGFLTSVYILVVPILALFLKKKSTWNVYLAILIGLIGLFIMSIDFSNFSFSFGSGEALILLGSLFFAFQIITIDHYSNRTNLILLSCIQLLIQGIINLIIRLFLGIDSASFISMFNLKSIISILFIGIFSSGVAYTLQLIGQKDVNPTVSSLIMSLESVFGALCSVIIYQFYKFSSVDQNMSLEEIIGSIILFSAVIFSKLPEKWFTKKEKSETFNQ